MKHLLCLLLACAFLTANAQQVAPLSLEDPKTSQFMANRPVVKLSIQLKNLPDTVKKVPIKYSTVILGNGLQVTRHTELTQNGKAEITLDASSPFQQVWLSVGDYLYAGVFVNNDLKVDIDVQKAPKDGFYMIGDGVTYAGTDGMLNTIMNKHVLFKKKEREKLDNDFRELCHANKKYTEDVFAFKIDSVRKIINQIDDEFLIAYPNYAWAIKNETASALYGMLCVAYWSSKMPDQFFKAISKHQPYFTSNDGALFYRYLNTYTRWYGKPAKTNWLPSVLALSDSLYSPAKSAITKLLFLEPERDNYLQSYPMLIESIQTDWCKKIAITELARAKANQQRIDSLFALSKKLEQANIGTPLMQLPFKANLYQLDKVNNIDEFILNLKSKFTNKALIIDFWATWCVPCLSDLPYSKTLHEANTDLPIEYVYLCTSNNSSVALWKNRIADLQLPGTHIYVNEKVMEALRTALNAEGGFPTYVVIDNKGKVNSKSITRMQALDRNTVKQVTGL